MRTLDVTLGDGRTLHAYDTAAAADVDGARLAVVWHHGTPNIGLPPEPLIPVAERLNLRIVSYDRPGYGGSEPNPGRTVGSAADDVAALADALAIDRFAVMGHSGGGPHALACAALLTERVVAAVSVSGLAPYGADGLDWFAGFSEGAAASLHAAAEGREAKERHEATATPGDPGFIAADYEAIEGGWSWVMNVVRPALEAGPAALIDDDLAYVSDWGFDPAAIRTPVLLLHGDADGAVPSSHSEWLARRIPTAELRLLPGDGHISALAATPAALEWLRSIGAGGRDGH